MPVTIRDIARKLKISHSTVSRVINNQKSDFFSADTRTRVLQTAEEMGYRPNYHARSLNSGRSMTIGLVLDGNAGNDRFWQRMLGGVEDGARLRGYDLVVIGAANGKPVLERAVQYCNERRVDALVVPGFLRPLVGSEMLENYDGPVVIASMLRYAKSRHICVDLDPAPGIEAAVKHLVQLGHRNILWFDVQGRTSEDALQRRDAFRSAATQLGIESQEFRPSEASMVSVEENVAWARHHFYAALERHPLATAVMCFNDVTAFGVYSVLAGRGITVPQQMSVVGFDDIYAEVASPPLTVASHMLTEIGLRAAELAIELSGSMENGRLMKSAIVIKRQHFVPSKLIVRKSTAPPRTH